MDTDWIVGIVLFIILFFIVFGFVWTCFCNKKGKNKHCKDEEEVVIQLTPSCKEKKKKKKKKCDCEKLKKKLKCIDKKAFLSVNGTGIIETVVGGLTIWTETWNDPKLKEFPIGKWNPFFGFPQQSPTAISGFAAPKSGGYWLEYHVGAITNGGLSLVLVNGNPLLRSLSWTFDFPLGSEELPELDGRQLSKSFLLHLAKGDVVSVIFIPFGSVSFINPFLETSIFRYLTTLSLELIHPDVKCCPPELSSTNDLLLVSSPSVALSESPLLNAPANKEVVDKNNKDAFFVKIKDLHDKLNTPGLSRDDALTHLQSLVF